MKSSRRRYFRQDQISLLFAINNFNKFLKSRRIIIRCVVLVTMLQQIKGVDLVGKQVFLNLLLFVLCNHSFGRLG